MRQPRLWALLLPLPFISPIAQAADDAGSTETVVTLRTTGRASTAPTLLTAVFSAQATAADAAAAQAKVNNMSADAAKQAGGVPHAKFLAQSYNVSQESDGKSQATHWTARQTLAISSTDTASLLQLTGKLQARGLALDDLRWSLDDKTQDGLHGKAQEDALHRLQAEASAAAHALGMNFRRFRNIHLDTPFEPRPMVMMARMSTGSPSAPPQRSEEDQDVRVTATGEAILTP